MKRKIILFLFVLFFINNLLFAGDVDANESKIPPLVKIADSKYRFGEVIIDQKKRTLEFNATTNQKNGLILSAKHYVENSKRFKNGLMEIGV